MKRAGCTRCRPSNSQESPTSFANEVDSLVSRTFARAQTPSRRPWLTAARRAVPGDRPTPSPRPVLTATRDFVSRHRSARRGRAPLRALFCPVRGLPPPVAVSSTARHALPDPSYHPVRAADSQHTLDCKTLVAEQRRRTARVCGAARLPRDRHAPLLGETRRDAVEILTTITRITSYSAKCNILLDFVQVSRYFLLKLANHNDVPKIH